MLKLNLRESSSWFTVLELQDCMESTVHSLLSYTDVPTQRNESETPVVVIGSLWVAQLWCLHRWQYAICFGGTAHARALARRDSGQHQHRQGTHTRCHGAQKHGCIEFGFRVSCLAPRFTPGRAIFYLFEPRLGFRLSFYKPTESFIFVLRFVILFLKKERWPLACVICQTSSKLCRQVLRG